MDIQTKSSVAKRNRLLKLLDIAVILAVIYLAWRLFFASSAAGKFNRPAPEVRLQQLDGKTFNLRGERGHTVFIDFYATWCEPCEQSIPYIEAFRRAHPDVRFVRIDVGEKAAVARAYARKHGFDNAALDPDAHVYDAFGGRGFPTIVAIDADGRYRDTWTGVNPRIGDILAAADAAYRAERRDAKK